MVWCGAMWFVWFSYYKFTNCIAPCGAVQCFVTCKGCGYAILGSVLVRFGEHPYL